MSCIALLDQTSQCHTIKYMEKICSVQVLFCIFHFQCVCTAGPHLTPQWPSHSSSTPAQPLYSLLQLETPQAPSSPPSILLWAAVAFGSSVEGVETLWSQGGECMSLSCTITQALLFKQTSCNGRSKTWTKFYKKKCKMNEVSPLWYRICHAVFIANSCVPCRILTWFLVSRLFDWKGNFLSLVIVFYPSQTTVVQSTSCSCICSGSGCHSNINSPLVPPKNIKGLMALCLKRKVPILSLMWLKGTCI